MTIVRAFAVLALCLPAIPATAAAPAELIAAIESDAARLVRSRTPPGLAVAIAVDGEVAYAGAFGVADLASRRPLTTQTPCPLGELSKLYTAVLALRLAAQGTIDLDDRLDGALPQITIASRFDGVDPGTITLRRLLSQHAGLPPERWGGMLQRVEQPITPARAPRSEDLYLLRPPGDLYGYSNVGYALAGEWLARAAGRPFEQAMRAHVFEPLALAATGYDSSPDRVVMHDGRTPQPMLRARDPAALGVHAGVADLARFLAALQPAKPEAASGALSPAQLSELWRAQNDDVALDFGWGRGLGVDLYRSRRDRVGPVLATASSHPDSFAELLAFPDHGLALAVLGNGAGTRRTAAFVRATVDRLLEWRAGVPPRGDDDLPVPERVPIPPGVQPDTPAPRYSTLAGLVPLRPERDGFAAEVMGWTLHARARADGWFRVRWHLLGFIPIDPGPLERLLVLPARAGARRVLLLWLDGRVLVVGSTFRAPPLTARWRALAGRWRLVEGDGLTERLKLTGIELAVQDELLVFRYTLPLPMTVSARIPAVPLGRDRLLVPGFGASLGEQARVEFGARPRLRYAGYLFEREE